MASAAQRRLEAHGLVGTSEELGGMRAAAALKLLQLCTGNLKQIHLQLEGEQKIPDVYERTERLKVKKIQFDDLIHLLDIMKLNRSRHE